MYNLGISQHISRLSSVWVSTSWFRETNGRGRNANNLPDHRRDIGQRGHGLERSLCHSGLEYTISPLCFLHQYLLAVAVKTVGAVHFPVLKGVKVTRRRRKRVWNASQVRLIRMNKQLKTYKTYRQNTYFRRKEERCTDSWISEKASISKRWLAQNWGYYSSHNWSRSSIALAWNPCSHPQKDQESTSARIRDRCMDRFEDEFGSIVLWRSWTFQLYPQLQRKINATISPLGWDSRERT